GAAVELSESATGLRQGIETGEVFLEPATPPTGAAIAAAARLAERAAPGEILLGKRAREALDADVGLEPQTCRLLTLHPEQPALLRAAQTPFVGRTQE